MNKVTTIGPLYIVLAMWSASDQTNQLECFFPGRFMRREKNPLVCCEESVVCIQSLDALAK